MTRGWRFAGGGGHEWRMQAKSFVQSRTIVGAIMMLVVLALQLFQVDVPTDELQTAEGHLDAVVQGIGALVGFILVIVGRVRAQRPVKFLGK